MLLCFHVVKFYLKEDSNEDQRKQTETSSVPVMMRVMITPAEYVLGIADLTGELMRLAINSVAAGQLDIPFNVCKFMQEICSSFELLHGLHRDLPAKLRVLKASISKVEKACYSLQIRGSEIPKHLLTTVFQDTRDDVHAFKEDNATHLDE